MKKIKEIMASAWNAIAEFFQKFWSATKLFWIAFGIAVLVFLGVIAGLGCMNWAWQSHESIYWVAGLLNIAAYAVVAVLIIKSYK